MTASPRISESGGPRSVVLLDDLHAIHDFLALDKLEDAKELAEALKLTSDEVRSFDNWLLRTACYHGNLKAAQWFVKTYKLTTSDVRGIRNEPLRSPCANGHLEVVKWVVATLGLTSSNTNLLYAVNRAVANGHLALTEWLIEEFGLTPSTVSSYLGPSKNRQKLMAYARMCALPDWRPWTAQSHPRQFRAAASTLLVLAKSLTKKLVGSPILPPPAGGPAA